MNSLAAAVSWMGLRYSAQGIALKLDGKQVLFKELDKVFFVWLATGRIKSTTVYENSLQRCGL